MILKEKKRREAYNFYFRYIYKEIDLSSKNNEDRGVDSWHVPLFEQYAMKYGQTVYDRRISV